MYSFRLIPRDELSTILPFLRILNEKIAEEVLVARLSEMQQQAYECVGVFDGDKLIAISGLWIMTKYYVGKHIEPDNVVVLPEYRGKGIGDKMMEWIYEYGRTQGCVASELNCYTGNHEGQKFWVNQGYKILGFHYQKQL